MKFPSMSQEQFFKILIFLWVFNTALIGVAEAQTQYDPLLDRKMKVLKRAPISGNGEYMWYPGQLSARLQQKRIKESNERCVNVGYPGKFYAPVFKTYFRKEVTFTKETIVKWESTGKVSTVVNGKQKHAETNTLKLPKGKSVLTFTVETFNDLPSIKVWLNNKISVDGWQTSLDGLKWNEAEASPVFGTAGRRPLDDPEMHAEIFPFDIRSLQNADVDHGTIIMQADGSVLIDFFHLEVGKVSFTANGKGSLSVFVGESVNEAMNENEKFFEQRPIQTYDLPGGQTRITLPERAARYVKIKSETKVEISGVKFTAKMWPVNFLMSFDCDDEKINNIWKASVASLHTSMHGFYLDGIKRDYLPWSMDAVLSTFAGDYLFGDEQVSRNSLSVALLPLNPQKSDLGIPDYPLHALIGFKQYYLRYGDFRTILRYRDRIEQLLRFYETLQDERGFISANVGVSWGFVPGWATRRGPDRKGTPTYAQIMLYYNYKIGADFSEKWGDKKSAKHYLEKAENLRKNIVKYFWDDEQGLFINGYTQKGEPDKVISHHAQYWAMLADIFPKDRIDNLFNVLPKIPYYKDYVSFEKGYEFIAYSKARKVREMWNFLHDVFGDWLAQGHTRFPENFSYKKSKDEQLVFYNRPFGLSLCHGANGVPGVVAVLHGIAGFSQSGTAPNHYTIQPDMMDLKWANIEFPVKEGKISLKLSAGQKTRIEIPSGCKVDFINNKSFKTTLDKRGVYYL